MASLWFYYKLLPFDLMQILYLVEVGLLLTFDLLACVDSQGMLYYYPIALSYFSVKVQWYIYTYMYCT